MGSLEQPSVEKIERDIARQLQMAMPTHPLDRTHGQDAPGCLSSHLNRFFSKVAA